MRNHVYILSPSGVINEEYVYGARRRLKRWGYEVSIAEHALCKYGRFAGTLEERMADLQRACDDDTIDIILCSRGGYGLAQYADKIRLNERQLVIGFSDITCLHSLAARRGITSLHGLMCKHISQLSSGSMALRAFKAMLDSWRDSCPLPEMTTRTGKTNLTGKAKGTLRGGNLSILYGLRGTPLDIPDEGRGTILFVEDISERAYHIDRMMQNLRMSGILSNLSGLIVGRFTDCDDDKLMHGSIFSRIREMTAEYGYPVCFGFPAGHVTHNMPLMLNRIVEIEVECDSIHLTYK